MNPYTPPTASLDQSAPHRGPASYFLMGLVLTQFVWTAMNAFSLFSLAAQAYISGAAALGAFLGFGLLYGATFAFLSNPRSGRILFLLAALALGLSHLGVKAQYAAAGPIELGLLSAVIGCWLVIKSRARGEHEATPQHRRHACLVSGIVFAQFVWTLTCGPAYVSLVSTGVISAPATFASAIALLLLYSGAIAFVRNGTRGRNFFIAAALLLGLSLTGLRLAYFTTYPVLLGLAAAMLGSWLAIKARATH
jgi:hypothetical protein